MSDAVSVDLGSVLPYLEDKVLALIGRDAASAEIRGLVDRHLRLAIRDAATVQVIGMDQPLSIFDIYQATTLQKMYRQERVDIDDLIHDGNNAVVFGGPGRGKTILLHYLFASLVRSDVVTPLLFTLRRSGAHADLTSLVVHLARKPIKVTKGSKLLLLVDGLDEIGYAERIDVANALRGFAAHNVGSFILTCRSFYVAAEVQAQHLEVTPFSNDDSSRFIVAFARAYGAAIDAGALLADLYSRGLADFATHPLLLAMVCILKAGPMPELPRSTVELMRRAVDTLTFRWDEARGIYRDSRLKFDGHDRLRCLVAIAFQMKKLIVRASVVERIAGNYLKLMHRTDIDPASLLRELAQWYGILVPVGEDWTFVHRTLHDFLAAKCWVETGRFNPAQVSKWDSRAAFAACLQPSATRSLVAALDQSDDLSAVSEILYNQPPFDVTAVADAFAKHFEDRPTQYKVRRANNRWTTSTTSDISEAAPNDLLCEFVARAVGNRAAPRILLAANAIAELHRRKQKLPDSIAAAFRDYYGANISFSVGRGDATIEIAAL